jgi:CelD/BcsL family acetyltransferase involved in cellulose biosynthesis
MLSFAFRHEGRLVGLAPLYIYREGTDQSSRVFLIGTGNSDYLDAVFRPDFRSACLRSLLSELQIRSHLWDVCDFQQLRSSSPLLQAREEICRFRVALDQQQPCPVLDLHSLDSSLTMEKRANHYQRRLEKSGSFAIERATPASFGEIFDALARLHEDRWGNRGISGAFSTERDRQFHRLVARAFLRLDILRLYAARLNGKIIAALYAFSHRKRTYFYLSGFDPEYGRFSIGTVLLGHAIEEARNQGSDEFDFLRGQEAYKYRWGARDQATFTMRLLKKERAVCA